MLSLLMVSTAAVAPVGEVGGFPCEGIRIVEASTRERPRAFASLRQVVKEMATVRDATGRRVQREVEVTNVKPIAGFSNCRYIYSTQIDLACYVGTTLPETHVEAISARLNNVAESVGSCLVNTNLVRSPSEVGSTPSINFGGGPRNAFWQISMVPSREDPSRIQPEVLVLGPVQAASPPRVAARPKSRAKRKAS